MKKIYLLLTIVTLLGTHVTGQWSNNPEDNLKITSQIGDQVIPKIALCPNGDYYFGYFSLESGNYNVRLQRLDNQGNILWANNGLLISDHPSMSWLTDWEMEADHENHAILSWQDIRLGGANNTVAYRISPEGDFVWGADGIQLSNSDAFDVSPKIAITSSNNAVFAWQADNVIIMQKISPSGEKLWGENGITLTHTNNLTWPQLMPVGNDEVIMKYFIDSGPAWSPTRHIYAQRFDANGAAVWSAPAVISNAGSVQAWLQILPMINDGNDGFYISWHDYRISGTAATSWLQHINSQGQAVFQANGVQLSNLDGANQFYTALAKPANDPNVYVYWNEVNGDQNLWGIFGQKIAPDGSILWGNSGKEIFPVTSQALLPQEAFSIENDVVLVYEHYYNGTQTSLRAVRLNNEGAFVWQPSELLVSTAESNKVHLDIAAFDGKQWVLTWEDDRTGDVELFAQNIGAAGTLGVIAGATGTLAGTLSIEGAMADVTEVIISAGTASTSPLPDGSYSMDLEAGTYEVIAQHPHTAEASFQAIVITEGETTGLDINLSMLRTSIECYVHDQYDWPIGGATVELQGPEDSYTGTTNAEGLFIVENAPYGWYIGSAYFHNPDDSATAEGMIDGSNQMLDFMVIIMNLADHKARTLLSIYPNPAEESSILSIHMEKPVQSTISITDNLGQKIAEKQITLKDKQTQITLNEIAGMRLTKGAYALTIRNEEDLQSIRFIIK